MKCSLKIVAGILIPLATAGCISGIKAAEQAAAWTEGDPVQSQASGQYDMFQILRNMEKLYPFAQKGDAEAQFRMGVMMHLFSGPEDDGVKYLMLAANQNHRHAQYELGRYFAGIHTLGGPRDAVKSYMWYEIADSGGQRCVDKFRGNYAWAWLPQPPPDISIYEQPMHAKYKRVSCAAIEREQISKKMTPEQIAEGKRRAKAWTPGGE